jgi:ATP-dependent helicase YprA (DUF1998 family)
VHNASRHESPAALAPATPLGGALADRAPSLTFLFASATIGNPSHHAADLLGLPVVELTENGAPRGARTVVLWQPPDEAGHSEEAAALMAFFLTHGLRTILFGQARQSVERMLREVRGRVPQGLANRVASYRAGYLAHERHAIHRRLAAGDLLGVVTTNALELGIDIGSLEVSILDGFPGSVASFWQQAGRAGRGEGDALTVLVLRQDALDQYFAARPEHLFDRPVEHALVNPSNPTILPSHVLCAAYEKPLTSGECDLFGPAAETVVTALVEQGRMLELAGAYRARGGDNPAYGLSLRQAGERITIVDVARGTVLEDTDVYHAISECYPGAIYFSQGTMYIVRNQDMGRRQLGVERCEVDYYTEPLEWNVPPWSLGPVRIVGETDRQASLDTCRDGHAMCRGSSYAATRRARRRLPWIFTPFSRALDAIFTPALLDWRVDKVHHATRGGRDVNRCALCEQDKDEAVLQVQCARHERQLCGTCAWAVAQALATCRALQRRHDKREDPVSAALRQILDQPP